MLTKKDFIYMYIIAGLIWYIIHPTFATTTYFIGVIIGLLHPNFKENI